MGFTQGAIGTIFGVATIPMETTNPYQSPRETGRNDSPRTRSVWIGPLISLSVTCFLLAFAVSTMTVVPELLGLQAVAMLVLTVMGGVCLTASFLMYRRARRYERPREIERDRNLDDWASRANARFRE